MDGKSVDVQELIARLNASNRLRANSHFSEQVARSEPIFTTGRQMSNYLPDRYREMRSISRLQERDGRKRWLSEAELFYQQARFMEDFEDDCPYHGRFTSYFPTYLAMSDRQLRGYFTWRTAVRHGQVAETCLSFAYVYLYELINGIGWTDPADGFAKIRDFWHAYHAFDTGLDRNVRVWLHDFAIYHALDPALLAHDPSVEHDRALSELVAVSAPFDPELRRLIDAADADGHDGATPDERPAPAAIELPLPPQAAAEDRMLAAIDALSAYRIMRSKLYRERPHDLRHVACAVFVRMLAYYRKHRSHGLIESSFGEGAEMSYTMFGSAVFFEEQPHPDATYVLDPLRSYRCHQGMWSCRRPYGGDGQSRAIGDIMHAVDCRLRAHLGFEPALQERKTPKYLAKIIDREIERWLTWSVAHAPRVIAIDRSKLSGIRTAAAATREALLIDEEREDGGSDRPAPLADGTELPDHATPVEAAPAAASAVPATPVAPEPAAPPAPAPQHVPEPARASADSPLAPDERAYLVALMDGTRPPLPPGLTDDMMVDRINEALFDELGDTAIEFGPDGPQVIEDYRDDLRRLMEQ